MTTQQLAERLARRLKKGTLTSLSMPTTMDVVEAINSGLQECYELLPAWQRRTTVSLTLPAPVTASLIVAAGSVDLGDEGGQFTSAQIGRSVVVAGDPNWNEVQSTAKLLDEYNGTSGTRSATIYGDSASNGLLNFDGLAGHPRLADTRETLIQFNPRAAGRAGEVGVPRYYWIEPAAASLGAVPSIYLRVSPAPDRAYVLRVDMEFRPFVVTLPDLHAATVIPLAEPLFHRALIPLCESNLIRSPEWADDSKARLVLDAADAAREHLSNQRPSPSVPSNRVFTPAGY